LGYLYLVEMLRGGNDCVCSAVLINVIDFFLTDQIVYRNSDSAYFPDGLKGLEDFRAVLHLHDDAVTLFHPQFFESIAQFLSGTVHLHVRYFLPLEDITNMLSYFLIF
jgi:hypothetical protein